MKMNPTTHGGKAGVAEAEEDGSRSAGKVASLTEANRSPGRQVPLESLVASITRHLVDHPEQVEVTKIAGAHITVLELRVAKGDAGQVIGRQGRTADALRTILAAVATKQRMRVMLDIID